MQNLFKRVCLLLQDLVQSCLLGGGGDMGGHVLRETTSRGLCGLLCERRRGRRREVREGVCIGAATILQPWTLRLILNAFQTPTEFVVSRI
jgi:hypothetical protein